MRGQLEVGAAAVTVTAGPLGRCCGSGPTRELAGRVSALKPIRSPSHVNSPLVDLMTPPGALQGTLGAPQAKGTRGPLHPNKPTSPRPPKLLSESNMTTWGLVRAFLTIGVVEVSCT